VVARFETSPACVLTDVCGPARGLYLAMAPNIAVPLLIVIKRLNMMPSSYLTDAVLAPRRHQHKHDKLETPSVVSDKSIPRTIPSALGNTRLKTQEISTSLTQRAVPDDLSL
jgi:hypothetical protein